MKRAIRRHHRNRIKTKLRRSILNTWYEGEDQANNNAFIGKFSSHHHSCGICCNRRKLDGITFKEKCDMLFVKEELKEYAEDY
jgi:hypothetical protein